MAAPRNPFEPITPTEAEVHLAQKLGPRLATHLATNMETTLLLEEGGHSEKVVLPARATRWLADALAEMAKGKAVLFSSIDAELTTQQAADFLNVSRPYLVRLLEEKKIPHRKVGTHRRVLARDVKEYKERNNAQRLDTLAQLVEQAQELDMGY